MTLSLLTAPKTSTMLGSFSYAQINPISKSPAMTLDGFFYQMEIHFYDMGTLSFIEIPLDSLSFFIITTLPMIS